MKQLTVQKKNKEVKVFFCMPVQWVSRPNSEFRGFAGKVISGSINLGERVKCFPSGEQAKIESILLHKESFSKGTIGNAIHMDRGLLEFYLAEGSPIENDVVKNNPDKEYVVFCGVGGQGTLATKTMKDMGVKNVKNISGGMAEWNKIKD